MHEVSQAPEKMFNGHSAHSGNKSTLSNGLSFRPALVPGLGAERCEVLAVHQPVAEPASGTRHPPPIPAELRLHLLPPQRLDAVVGTEPSGAPSSSWWPGEAWAGLGIRPTVRPAASRAPSIQQCLLQHYVSSVGAQGWPGTCSLDHSRQPRLALSGPHGGT